MPDDEQRNEEYNKITRKTGEEFIAGGKRFRVDSSEMIYIKDQMVNSRSTAKGRKADRAVRNGVYPTTGRHSNHRHSMSGHADPADRENTIEGNALQNLAGGAKSYNEGVRDKAVRDGATVNEKSEVIYSLDRSEYSTERPIAEKVTQTFQKGEESRTSTLYLGNFDSSTSRYADAQAAKREKTSLDEMKRLQQQDKQNLRDQGNGTVRQAQKQTLDLKARELAGEMVQWARDLRYATGPQPSSPRQRS